MVKTAPPEPDLLGAATQLRLAVSRIVRRLRQDVDRGELTAAELSLLTRLEQHGPAGTTALAVAEQVRPPVICTMLAGLQERGLVARAGDPTDGRRVAMSLTGAGRRVLTDRRSALAGRIARVLDERFTVAEQRQLVDALPLLQRLATQL